MAAGAGSWNSTYVSTSSRRYIVGIDLGTTNTAVAWVDTQDDAEPEPRVRPFPVPQLVAEGELAARPTLPSFLYLAGEHDLPAAATRLPWDPESRVLVGELARTQGARVPGRMIASAKSWLCHAGVDRQAAILPWGAADGPRLSPVDTSARILGHVAAAWQHAMNVPLAEADIIVTVPASFDEVARELTVEAARRAGLETLTLVEEPQAVFYAWIDAHPPHARRRALAAGERVLVCDVGGGTTDFTMIDVGADGDSFDRSAVGDHLLLGGDNLDIALARRLETRLPAKLDAVQWHGLVHACRLAKEQLLSDAAIDRRPITVAARGARLVGGALRGEIAREEVDELVLDGFFPLVPRDARPARGRTGIHELGLPYAADAAITRHLAAFLGRHRVARVDALLFNGGAMKPPPVRARVLAQVAAWQEGGPAPRELANAAPDLAVAHGAAYYGLVRRGLGARIRGGAARAYYVGVEGGAAVCVLPRGAEEGTERELAHDLVAVINRPVSFRLCSSSSRGDQPGDVIPSLSDAPELLELPPLVTVLRAPGIKQARVRLRARLTELGTLEIWCQEQSAASPQNPQHPQNPQDRNPRNPPSPARWRLSFDLRSGGAASPDAGEASLGPEADAMKQTIAGSFAAGPGAVSNLARELERISNRRRDEWGTALCRSLWDATYLQEPARRRTAEVEARWLNLVGFLLRPGVGAPLDDWRIKEMWKVFNAGLHHDKDEACRLTFWIVWRRVAAGLKRTQQEQFFDRLSVQLLPGMRRAGKPPRRVSPQETAEMWRTLASMERLIPSAKSRLGEALLDRLEKGKDNDFAFWALGRLGARAPLYGPADVVVSPQIAGQWLERLLALEWTAPDKAMFPAAQIGRRTGDRARDIDEGLRSRLAMRLRTLPGGDRTARLVEEVIALEAREERVAFGDSLPAGFRRADLADPQDQE
jgi:molecular chaperone DnaK (HSP70)